MASMSLTMTTIPKFRQVGVAVASKNSWRPRSIVTAAPQPLQAARNEASAACDKASQTVKQGANEMGSKAEQMKNKAKSGAEEMSQKTKGAVGKVPESAQEMGVSLYI